MKRLVLSTIVTLALLLPLSQSQAILSPSDVIKGPTLTVKISPENAKPGDTVTVKVESFDTDLNRATIRWSVGGKSLVGGIGVVSQQVTVGNSGENKTVNISVQTIEGKTYTQTAIIKSPQPIDMVWQAQSYTPVFYRGRAHFPFQGTVKIEAIPNLTVGGKRVDPKNLVYTWKSDDDVLSEGSGYGKNSIKLESSGINIRPLNISVEVSTLDNKVSGIGLVTIGTQGPTNLFYVDSPLYGILYNRSLPPSFRLEQKEIIVHSAPYFFSTTNLHKTTAILFNWSINGNKVLSENTKNDQIVLRKPDNVVGSSQISLKLTSTNNLLQYATGNFLIGFGSQQ